MSAGRLPDLDGRKPVGFGRAALIALVGVVAYFLAGLWLIYTAAWPADCSVFTERLVGSRVYFLDAYRCSPGLLGGGLRELATFGWLWALPALVLLVLAWGRRRRKGGAR